MINIAICDDEHLSADEEQGQRETTGRGRISFFDKAN